MIYQMHPEHGRHIAYNHAEAKYNVECGWVTVTQEEYYAGILEKTNKEKEESSEAVELSREDLEELYVLKFGDKPHHAMKDATIIAKLG